MVIIKYNVVQTGAKIQSGGLKEGFIIDEYQGSLKPIVAKAAAASVPARAPMSTSSAKRTKSTSRSNVEVSKIVAAGADFQNAVAEVFTATIEGIDMSTEEQLDVPFFELGVNSLQAVLIARELSERLAISVPAVTLFQHTTARRLAAFIATRMGSGAQSGELSASDMTEEAQGNFDAPAAIGAMSLAATGIGTSTFKQLLACGHNAMGEVPAARWQTIVQSDAVFSRVRYAGFAVDIERYGNYCASWD